MTRRTAFWRDALLTLALWLAGVGAAAAETWTEYRVQQGDTLYDLAAGYLTDVRLHRDLGRVNNLPPPRRLQPGTIIRIPDAWLRTTPIAARLAAFRGQVAITDADGGAQAPALNMAIGEGAHLTTGPDSFLTLELPDASRVTLPSRSRVQVLTLRRVLLTGEVRRSFALENGRATVVVTPAPRPGDSFTITTPLTVSAVRGTAFRVAHDAEARRSALEVVEGRVDNSRSDNAPVEVSQGFGLVTDADGEGGLRPLLPPPRLRDPGRPQDEPQLAFALEPQESARGYRAQIASDAGFVDILAEAEATGPDIGFPGLPNGVYFARFSVLDEAGLEGLPAAYAFERRLNALDLAAPSAVAGAARRFLFRWTDSGEGRALFRFQLSTAPDMSAPLVDEPALEARSLTVTDLPDGIYYWRVRASRFEDGQMREKWSPIQRFQLGG